MGVTGLHPAQHRGYRELFAYSRQLTEHWSALAPHFEDSDAGRALTAGAERAGELIAELEPLIAAHDLHGGPAAGGVGSLIAGTRIALRDRSLERNQALRWAVQDAEHLTTLLAYLGTVAECRDQEQLASFCQSWQNRMRRVQSDLRKAAAELGEDPDSAIAPLDPSPLGRAAHRAGHLMGSLGEWFDRRAANRRGD